MLFAAGKVGDLVFRTGLPAREAIDHAPTLWRRRFDARQLAHVGGAGLIFQKCARRCLLHHVLGFSLGNKRPQRSLINTGRSLSWN